MEGRLTRNSDERVLGEGTFRHDGGHRNCESLVTELRLDTEKYPSEKNRDVAQPSARVLRALWS